MSIVTLDNLAVATPDGRVLFENLSLTLGAERTGLVGANGVGKSTLLAIVAGERAPAAGTVACNGRIGVLRQTLSPPPGASVADRLGIAEDLARLARAEAGEADADDLALADWDLEARVAEGLADMGLAGLALDRPAASLSGGQLTRLDLAGLLIARPDLILLDEPTNNLDAAARAQVASLLRGWRGGALVVSHDRALLREMDRIVELSSLGARVYGGHYDLYAERKAAERAAAERGLDLAEREADRAAREAQQALERKARRDAAGRKFAAKGSEPKILLGAMAERAENSGARGQQLAERRRAAAAEAIEAAQAQVERVRTLAFDLPPSGLAAGKMVLAFEDVGFGYGGAPVLEGVSLKLTGPERVAVVGPNGSGKTTLLRLAAGELAPTAGTVRRGAWAVLVDQQTAVLGQAGSVLDAFQRLNPGAGLNAAHAALARFLFRNSAAHQAVASLSGGERLRAALACVLSGVEPPQLLILDEPTNHLDLSSLEAVEAALRGYDGAILAVSHDADFLAAIGVEREIRLG
ncbi:ATPase subunit of ABC transporter with duplicated ATPase domains [Caulobacter ginsengisoli]|uniref:ATPase subunit of ABC transporter with duplicated ATPase domains n=1 Tax=Caulobacter ginsengisoli TaxID=400775 RepID=A0ABU0IPB6_9CAUL|nr:ABC-F family ATP-binding cassette domain-containing protein [Caulobacter ginsengisoli]MDQ0463839.1 ATPase subunit of ABC transporter with duplicated ATPase domains [Caulobacter ginsengisoli]